jgi:uncharacterized protein YvpB
VLGSFGQSYQIAGFLGKTYYENLWGREADRIKTDIMNHGWNEKNNRLHKLMTVKIWTLPYC